VTVSESGRTRVRQRFAVAAPVGGTLARIALRAGDPVERGDVVARVRPLRPPLLDPRSRAQAIARVRGAQAAQEQARQQLDRAEALLSFARGETARARALASSASVPARNVEAAIMEEQARAKEAAAARWA